MTHLYVFDASLGVFKHHFGWRPVVPGAMLLDHFVSHLDSRREDKVVNISAIRFHRFLRPGTMVQYINAGDGAVEVHADGVLCCAFGVEEPVGRLLPSAPELSRPLRSFKVAALRDPAYWFLGDEILVDDDGRRAICHVDLNELERGHAWIRELDRWRPLALIESAGNLACVLTSLKRGAKLSSNYVLARIDEVGYSPDCCGWFARQSITVEVRRHGALLVWDAWITDEVATRIAIRGAVSRLERIQ